MQVNQTSILKFLKTANSLIVPVYQRDYAWRVENCKKLWEDINEIGKSKRKNHFLGTLVTINDNIGKYLVIDGQQRLTTLTLLILALIHHLEEKKNKTPEENQLKKILKPYIIDDESLSIESRIKLKPNKFDNQYFQDILLKNDTENINSNIVQNYKYFKEIFDTRKNNYKQLFDNFKKIEIVSIDLLHGQDDPQLIFESLNSTGVDLTDGDLIRNYILMDLEPKEQEFLYSNYWIKIEKLTGDIAEFARNFLMFKLQKNVTQTKRAVYNEFKKYSEDKFEKNSELILKELLKYAHIYSYFISRNKHPEEKIQENLNKLYNLEFRVAHPFLFEVFELYENQILETEIVLKIIHLIESYAFRKIIVSNTTQGLNKFFLTLGKEIKKLDKKNWQNKYFDIMKFIIKNKSASQKFPTDEEFENILITKEIYKLRSKNRDFLLHNLENYKSSYKVNLSDLTVEHIMPQKLTHKWKQTLGENWKDIHSNYLHTLGNLTLTANNSKLSNNDFKSKQAIDLNTSKLKLSYEISNIDDWNKEKIIERSKKLAKEAVEIWQYPKTGFKKEVEKEKIYVLDENLDLKGTKPIRIFIGNDFFRINHWLEIRKVVCQKFYNESPTEFREMMNKSEISRYFSEDKNKLKSCLEFSKGLFVEIHGSTTDTFRFIIKLCNYFHFDITEISFEIR